MRYDAISVAGLPSTFAVGGVHDRSSTPLFIMAQPASTEASTKSVTSCSRTCAFLPKFDAASSTQCGVALVSGERWRGGDQMKQVIIFALVLLGALAPVASVAEAHWDDACHCDEVEAP